ncbi:phage major capsid protein [Trueperella sp. LYQ141]|uniref:phage major capsid protein n=1 Tax=Trueperella sp. LYQ141 TaxID=3391058 RepID=UPI003983DA67
MAILDSKTLSAVLPRNIAEGMIKKTLSTSTVAKLSGQEPMKFGTVDILRFNNTVRAEFVEENADKSSTVAAWDKVTAVPHKAQVTIRTSNEFMWADEDYQLGVLDQVAEAGANALSRALDMGLYHRVNPHTGNVIASWTNYLTATKKTVTQGSADADADIRQAIGLVIDDGTPITGLALDPKMAFALANLQCLSGGKPNGMPRYPELGFGTDITSFLGVKTAVGTTISGLPEAAKDTGVRAIVGDFADGIRWGVQRDLPLELIPYGDPDGQGDLKRKNQIALRLEIVYGWYVMEDRFALIKTAAVGG